MIANPNGRVEKKKDLKNESVTMEGNTEMVKSEKWLKVLSRSLSRGAAAVGLAMAMSGAFARARPRQRLNK